jgi:small subunit ribosomal protein S2
VAEARKLNIPTFAIVDTNSAIPTLIDFPIPANDDAAKSIYLILSKMVSAIEEGLMERKLDKDKRAEDDDRDFELDEDGRRIYADDEDEDSATGDKRKGEKGAPRPRGEEDSSDRSRRPRKAIAKPIAQRKGPPRK